MANSADPDQLASLISWLLQKPADLDLHCLQRQGISGFSRTRVNIPLLVEQPHLPIYLCIHVSDSLGSISEVLE